MSEAAPHRSPPALRVAIAAADPVRRMGLAAIVAQAGYTVSDGRDDADVVLADEFVASEELPVVALGGAEAGQAGPLPREAAPEQVVAAIRAVAAGLYVRPAAAARPSFTAMPEPEPQLLTPREVEVLAAIANGLSNKAVARRLGISQHTVKFHVESLLRKLGAASRAEAIYKGLRQGAIEL